MDFSGGSFPIEGGRQVRAPARKWGCAHAVLLLQQQPLNSFTTVLMQVSTVCVRRVSGLVRRAEAQVAAAAQGKPHSKPSGAPVFTLLVEKDGQGLELVAEG